MKAVVPKERINKEITVDEVRLIDENNQQIGVVSIQKALSIAEEANLDLVEVSPNAEPPVCRILDFSKYYYQKEKKTREAKKKQHVVQLKEIKFGPNTDEHDYNFKKNNAIRFLKAHNKVKLTIKFRGRQIAHKELGYDVLERLEKDLAFIAEVDSKPTAEKNLLSMILSPKKDIDKILGESGIVVDETTPIEEIEDDTEE
ncbi:MAG: translation initiation factor IF-3 [Candidatus Cloacimonetes bacterium]|nr:translation initiation factor IF-3 [Candidatus Cloacimonadota bacterium]